MGRLLMPVIILGVFLCSCSYVEQCVDKAENFKERTITIEVNDEIAYIDLSDFDHDVTYLDNGIEIKASTPSWISYYDLKTITTNFQKDSRQRCKKTSVELEFNHPDILITITSDNPETVKKLQRYAAKIKEKQKTNLEESNIHKTAEYEPDENLHDSACINRKMEILKNCIRVTISCNDSKMLYKLKDYYTRYINEEIMLPSKGYNVSKNIEINEDNIVLTFSSDNLDSHSIVKQMSEFI